MKYNGKNLREVLVAHLNWIHCGVEDGRADFVRADLRGVNLLGADLFEADLTEADLTGANLTGVNLVEADLTEASLMGADLREANLYRANLTGADLRGANLTGANLSRARNVPFLPMACPDAGAFVGWKKCIRRVPNKYVEGAYVSEPCIVKLLIPEDAERSSATGRKCRASCATVLEIQTLDGEVIADTCNDSDVFACSNYDSKFIYRPGETVCPRKPFDHDRWNECGSGIHFFINRQEAVNY